MIGPTDGSLGVRVEAEIGICTLPRVLSVVDTKPDTLQIIMCMPQSRMDKFTEPLLHPIDIANWVDGPIENREAIQSTCSNNVLHQEQ